MRRQLNSKYGATGKSDETCRRFVLQVHVTSACDSNCVHCYQRGIAATHMMMQDFRLLMQQFGDLLDALEQERGFRPEPLVTITGGEPLMHPMFKELVFCAWLRGFEVAVLTNGHLMDEATAAFLRDARFVQVSLDGNEPVHDSMRGKGDFARVLTAIRLLKKAGANPIVSFTAHEGNFRTLPEAARAARKAGANRFWSDRYLPLDEGCSLNPLDADQVAEYLSLLSRSSKKRGSVVVCHRALQSLCGGEPYRCHAARDILAVDEACRVMPCRRLPQYCGDFRQTPLHDLYWHDPTFVELRAFSFPDECTACEHASACGGGLRCMSAAALGDWHRADPGCPLVGALDSLRRAL